MYDLFHYLPVIFMMWIGGEDLLQHLDNAIGEPLDFYNFVFS